jgi:hypothetical protein
MPIWKRIFVDERTRSGQENENRFTIEAVKNVLLLEYNLNDYSCLQCYNMF